MCGPHLPLYTLLVFDCSSKYKGICLNDCLLQGPNITNSLLGVLFRFRRGLYAIQGDIRSMFHMVGVAEHHRDFLRFLWWDGGDLSNKPQQYRMCVFLFGTVRSPACTHFALQQTARDNQSEYSEATIQSVNECFYVDDCLASVSTIEQAKLLLHELVELLARGGFKLTKWTSNRREIISSVPPDNRSTELSHLDLSCNPLPNESALGLTWDAEADTLCFRTKHKHKTVTRRGILSVLHSLYDPLGFSSPVIQPVKVLLQNLCKSKIEWDDSIPPQLETQRNTWLEQLPLLSSFQIPRCYQTADFNNIVSARIHHFSDASLKSYGYVSYLRLIDDRGAIHCSFLFAKTKLTPLKVLTIPRLELCAATLSSNYDVMLHRELRLPYNLEPSLFRTDSTTVLKYINCEDRAFHVFVANRVQTIRNQSEPNLWKYVSTKQNPADFPSRGMNVPDFLTCEQWKSGPEFLWLPESSWPQQPFLGNQHNEDLEFKKATISCSTAVTQQPSLLQDLISRFSCWTKLVRVVAWIIRAKKAFLFPILKEKTNHNDVDFAKPRLLSVGEISEAENTLVRFTQSGSYQEELSALKSNKDVKTSSSLAKLDLFLQDGIIRVGGRINHSSFPYSLKHPIILPNKAIITNLLIKNTHIQLGHAGRQHVFSTLREKFWVINANSAVRRELLNCVECKRNFGATCTQKMAPLPAERLTPDKPAFTWVGLDYFGPFFTRHGRSNNKCYGVIFTCLGTRAVHIEIALSLDTSSFIMALRRFLSRRGQVTRIISDNGTNLRGGERELRLAINAWNNDQVHDFLLHKGIDWAFNPPGASHHGAVYERQIRSFRKIFNGVAREQVLTDETLTTLACEVEAILNSRPLTTVSDDACDLESFTPNHLLLLKAPDSLPPGVFRKEDLHSRKLWRQVQYLANLF